MTKPMRLAATGGGPATYIEDVFNTYLYTGNGSTQTITTGVDTLTDGGVIWFKGRQSMAGGFNHQIIKPDANPNNDLFLNTATTDGTSGTTNLSRTTTGFTLNAAGSVNYNTQTFAAWTFKKKQKFFDVVTYTGNGANRTVSHNLGAVPGCILVKRTDTTGDWQVYHRGFSLINPQNYMVLNTTAAFAVDTTVWNSTAPTSNLFSLGTNAAVNANGGTYIAYLFAHNAGGFGQNGTDNVISCGSYAGNGSATGPVLSLGYEPQWLMIKNASNTSNWNIIDNMRGMIVGSADATLQANLSNPESSVDYVTPTATGFQVTSTSTEVNTNGNTYIYIAVRRGPMKIPTSGTSVLGLNARTGTGANATATGSAGVSDAVLIKNRGAAVGDLFASRLTGTGYLETSSTAAQVAAGTTILQASPWDVMDGVKVGTTSTITNASTNTFINYLFDRAPNFFDVVCDTGTGVAKTVTHNLGVVPELLVRKGRSGATQWEVYSAALGDTQKLVLNSSAATATDATAWNNTTPTSTVFTVGTGANVNTSAATYATLLFASCPGVSKVGSYTGNGTSQTINCGFTGGARFVMIKRTDSTGGWFVFDSARGFGVGNDPRLSLNTTAAEVTTEGGLSTASSGFLVTSDNPPGINVNGATYIFLAIA